MQPFPTFASIFSSTSVPGSRTSVKLWESSESSLASSSSSRVYPFSGAVVSVHSNTLFFVPSFFTRLTVDFFNRCVLLSNTVSLSSTSPSSISPL